MRLTRPIATCATVAWYVSQSVCLSDTRCVKTAVRIEVLFWMENIGDAKQIVLDGSLNLFTVRRRERMGEQFTHCKA